VKCFLIRILEKLVQIKLGLAFTILVFGTSLFSQNYSYRDYLFDHQILKKSNKLIRENKIDSLKVALQDYKDHLGYTYFQFKALIANSESDSSGYKYLDSAFMRGMTPLCLGKHIKKFDSTYVYISFQKNYLKAYDLKLINLVDSIHYRDQYYRQQISVIRNLPKDSAPKRNKKEISDSQKIKLKKESREYLIDSLWRLQSITDSLNFEMLNKIIARKGWPSAKELGDHYCQRPAADVTLLIVHLGSHKRDYQIATLKNVIDLCRKQEDSWGNAVTLLSNLHNRFKREFSEFSFLVIKENHIIDEESFFSIHTMVGLMMDKPSEKIQIKCKRQSLFTELKLAMLNTDEPGLDETQVRVRKRLGHPLPKNLDESSFEFIEAPELDNNMVFYKMVQK
jgi:hypothetical protein